MKFTIDQIKEAHSKVKSGADFPKYVQDIIKLGVIKYSTYVSDGHAEYSGAEGYNVRSEDKYSSKAISENPNNESFIRDLKFHQQGGTDYMTFCSQASQSGVEKWTVDTEEMTCTYYDRAGNKMLVEKIPKV